MRRVVLALAVIAGMGGAAHAGEPQHAFRTTTAKSRVPVTPKVTISSANRRAGYSFGADGSLKIRKLPSGRAIGNTGNTGKATGK